MKQRKVVYVAHNNSLHRTFVEFLSKLDIDINDFSEIKVPTRFKKFILPDSSFYLDDNRIEHFTKEYVSCINKVKEQYKANHPAPAEKFSIPIKMFVGLTMTLEKKSLNIFFKQMGLK